MLSQTNVVSRVTLGHQLLRKTGITDDVIRRLEVTLSSMGVLTVASWELWRVMRQSSSLVDPDDSTRIVPFVAITEKAVVALTGYIAMAAKICQTDVHVLV